MMITILSKLRYHPKWARYEFVDEEFLRGQVEEYEAGDDRNTEHYRYAAFRHVLRTIVMNDLTVDRYVELAALDEDQTMASAALGLLVRHKGLTKAQLNRLKGHSAFAGTNLQTLIMQTELLRELDSKDLTADLFVRCVSVGKDKVQRKLLGKADISPQQLIILNDRGANRAIRNIAKEKLRRQMQ